MNIAKNLKKSLKTLDIRGGGDILWTEISSVDVGETKQLLRIIQGGGE